MRFLLVALMFVLVSLAGCVDEGDGDGDSGGDGDTADKENLQEAEAAGLCISTEDESVNATEVAWVMATTMGTMRFVLFCDKTPITAQNMVTLTEDGYFDGIKFHRVIEGFMNQGGDPLTKDDSAQDRWGTGGPGYTIVDEFYCADGSVSHELPAQCPQGLGLKHDKAGVLSMANTGRPETGGSQFFITAVATPHLDGRHAVFGEVADEASREVALAINQVETDSRDRPVEPVVIESAHIEWE